MYLSNPSSVDQTFEDSVHKMVCYFDSNLSLFSVLMIQKWGKHLKFTSLSFKKSSRSWLNITEKSWLH